MKYEPFREKKFTSADELWEALSPTRELYERPNSPIYRGHGSSEWKLIPSALRADTENPLTRSWGK